MSVVEKSLVTVQNVVNKIILHALRRKAKQEALMSVPTGVTSRPACGLYERKA